MSDVARRRSVLPGRVRWEVPSLLHRPRLAAAIVAVLQAEEGIASAVANPRTGRLLVLFERELRLERLEATLLDALRDPTGLINHCPDAGSDSSEHDHARGEGHHASGSEGSVRNLVIGGATLAVIALKRLFWGRGVLVKSPVLFGVSALATIVSGYPFIRGAFRTLTGRERVNTDTLVGSATVASLLMRENITALVVVWILNLGEYLQALTLTRTRKAIRALLSTDDDEVWLLVEGTEVKVSVANLSPGDMVAVYAGYKIPADGTVVSGSGAVNEAPITGESMPAMRNVGDSVFAGTILISGELKIRSERVGHETAVGKLIERVEEAEALRAPIETIGSAFSARFVPASFLLSLIVLVLTRDVNRALTMLLVACPCAAGLSTPTAVSAAIGNGARRGILIKGGTHVEAAAGLDTVALDKTGTLTTGSPYVERVISLHDAYRPEEVLGLAASGELHSKHPIALAVVKYAKDKQLVIPPHDKCEIIVGRGMHAYKDGDCSQRVLVGNAGLLEQFGVRVSDMARAAYAEQAASGATMMYVARHDVLIGIIGVRDQVRTHAADAIRELRAMGLSNVVMLTGDSEQSARTIADLVGIEQWHARLIPEQKYEFIRSAREQGRKIAMVGDGINDAPALALADVGIAMGAAGSDVAIDTADVALASDDLRQVATTVRLSRKTLRLIKQNYGLALGINSIGLAVGALGVINPFMAAGLHNLSTLLVLFNSGRLIGYEA